MSDIAVQKSARQRMRWPAAVVAVVVLVSGIGVVAGRSAAGRFLLYDVTARDGSRAEDVVVAPYPTVLEPANSSVDSVLPNVSIATTELATETDLPDAESPDAESSEADVARLGDARTEQAVPIRLAVAGDVGTAGSAEYATAASMDRLEEAGEYDALLLLGDNIYPDGNPAEVDRRVFDPFAGVLDGATQLLPVLGNHDNDDGYGEEQMVALGMPGRWYSTVIGDALIVSLDSNRPDDAEQLEWLEQTLAAATQTWKIVEMHHPPYSGGWHGSDHAVRSAFVPIFERYGVQLVLAGHDHDYQRTEQISGVTYVVSGGAANLREANLAEFSVVALSINHFTDITIWDRQLDVRAVDHDGNVFDNVTLQLD